VRLDVALQVLREDELAALRRQQQVPRDLLHRESVPPRVVRHRQREHVELHLQHAQHRAAHFRPQLQLREARQQ